MWERLLQHLAADADNEFAMIDSTIVRAHQHSAGAVPRQAVLNDKKPVDKTTKGTQIHA